MNDFKRSMKAMYGGIFCSHFSWDGRRKNMSTVDLIPKSTLEYWLVAINKDELKPLEHILFPTMLNMVVIAVTVNTFVFYTE